MKLRLVTNLPRFNTRLSIDHTLLGLTPGVAINFLSSASIQLPKPDERSINTLVVQTKGLFGFECKPMNRNYFYIH